MRMKNPAHPGQLVRDDIEELGLSVAEAARGLGVTRQHIYRIITGTSAISPEMALRLEKAIGGTADFWMQMQVNFDLAQIRARAAEIVVTPLVAKVA